jgi:hypothetical protein
VAVTRNIEATVEEIEKLLVESGAADLGQRKRAEQIVRLLMELYGSGLERIVGMLGAEQTGRLAQDKLVGSLLLLHGLHPLDAEARVRATLERLERSLDGRRLILVEVSGGVARVRVVPDGASSAFAQAIQRSIAECAPDLTGCEIEGIAEREAALVQIAPVSR